MEIFNLPQGDSWERPLLLLDADSAWVDLTTWAFTLDVKSDLDQVAPTFTKTFVGPLCSLFASENTLAPGYYYVAATGTSPDGKYAHTWEWAFLITQHA